MTCIRILGMASPPSMAIMAALSACRFTYCVKRDEYVSGVRYECRYVVKIHRKFANGIAFSHWRMKSKQLINSIQTAIYIASISLDIFLQFLILQLLRTTFTLFVYFMDDLDLVPQGSSSLNAAWVFSPVGHCLLNLYEYQLHLATLLQLHRLLM